MQHSIWHKVPFVRILLAFACGIGTSMFYTFNLWAVSAAIAFFLLASALIPIFLKAYQHRWFTGVSIEALFFCCGIFVHLFQDPLSLSSHFSYVPRPMQFAVMINKEPVEKTSSYKLTANVLQGIDSVGNTHFTTGYLLLYISKKDSINLPSYGDIIMVSATNIREVAGPKNPFEFDYKRYLAFNHIHHQVYTRSKQLIRTNLNRGNPLFKCIYSIQRYFKQTLDLYVKTPGEVGVAQALLYGFDDNIDETTMSAYANTGTLHVLAVSGMHVGLILFILNSILFFMNKNRRLLTTKRIIILISLWAYSALCGLSPSILRATVMFSFIIAGQMLERKSNIYNTLAASCFVLLCFDANMLANVGFQLSYTAVIGIVFLQPLIEKWHTPTTWLGKQVWSITCVSVAAQLATSPIGILYFHQFPFCFLFSNLLIIPLTTGIIYVTLALLAFSWWPALSELVGYVIQQLILFTNRLVLFVEALPYSYTNGLQISILQSVLLYVAILGFVFYFMYRYGSLLKLALLAIFCFCAVYGIEYLNRAYKTQLVVYGIANSNVIHVINGSTSKLFIDDHVRYDKQKFRFHLQQHIWHCRLTHIDTLSNQPIWQQVRLNGKQVLLSGENNCANPGNKPDILILRNRVPIEKIVALNPRILIISGKLNAYQCKRMVEFCNANNIPVHNVMDSGAYELIL